MKKTIFTILIFLLPTLLFAQDGVLDPSFDSDGKVTTPFGSSGSFGRSVAVQADGKIVVAGESINGDNNEFAVVRYNSDGSLDNSFDSDGKITTSFGPASEWGRSVAIQADGKIVVAGYALGGVLGTNEFAVARYNSDGSLDNSFDSDGKVTTSFGSSNAYGNSVAIQADGKIVVVGYSFDGSNYDLAVARYNSNGSLDNTFDSDGKVITSIGPSNDFGHSVVIQADGKIVVAGQSVNANRDFAIVRYNSDGSLDNSFDSDGKVLTSIGPSDEMGLSIAIQADSKIVVAGQSNNGSNIDFALVRYNSNGSLDNSFDSDGKVTTSFGSADDFGRSVAIQADGKIVVAGYSRESNDDFAIVRYNSDGSLDNSFDSDGKVTTPIGSSGDVGECIAIRADGKIVVAGYSYNGSNNDFAVAVYNNPSLPVELTTFTASIFREVQYGPNSAAGSKSVELNWETATEVNNYGFEVERQNSEVSSQKSDWEKVAFVEGHGNSNSPKRYSFSDNSVSAGKYNYRLKQIDIDGSYEYSNVVEIDLGLPSDFTLSQNYPNPFNPTTTIAYTIPYSVKSETLTTGRQDAKVKLVIFDILGKEVATLVNEERAAGNYKVEFDASAFSSGVYYYQLKTNQFMESKKMLILK